MKNFSLVTVSGSSHASLIVAYEAVCGAFLGVARKDDILLDVGPHLVSPLCHNNILYPSVRTKFQGNTVDPVSLTKSSRRAGVS